MSVEMSIESSAVLPTSISCAAKNLNEVWLGEGKKITGKIGNWQIGAYRAIIIDPELVYPEIIKALPNSFDIGRYMPDGWNQIAHIVFDPNGKAIEAKVKEADENRILYLLDSLKDVIDKNTNQKDKWKLPQSVD